MTQDVNRRKFLKALAGTAAAATIGGTGAALLLEPKAKATPLPLYTIPPSYQPPVTGNGSPAADSLSQLAAFQAENVRLQAALDAANRQLLAFGQDTGNRSAIAEELRLQLDDANNQAGLLAGLVALYEQLDGIDLDSVIDGGVAAVGEAVSGLIGNVPGLEEGLAAGRAALDELEQQLPILENGRLWLNNHLAMIRFYYQFLENVLATAVETAGAFLEMLNGWFQDILKWLPFGMGRKAAGVMDALTNLLQETPNTIAGLDTNVAQPLAVWLAADASTENEMPIRRRVVRPLREQALAKATATAGQARTAEATFRERLAQPVNETLTRTRAMKAQIVEYRFRHHI